MSPFFPHNISYPSKNEFQFVANAFNLDKYEILSIGKDLTCNTGML